VGKRKDVFGSKNYSGLLFLSLIKNINNKFLLPFKESGMQKLKKETFMVVILLIICFPAQTIRGDQKINQIYNKIVEMANANTPQSYTVTVENRKFTEALKELPEDILTGKGKPSVVIRFKKGEGFRVVIENIKKEYESLFSMYEDYFKFSGISKVQNPQEFKEIIDQGMVDYYGEEGKYVIVQAWDPEKKVKDDTYALFYLDKKNWVISKAEYFLDGVLYVEAENSYKLFGKYYLPYRIVLNYLNEQISDVFMFKDYRFNK